MKRILLLLACIYTVINCNAQQKVLDSLLNELKRHPQEDTVHLKILLDIAQSYSLVDGNKGLIISNQTIAMAKKLHDIKQEAIAYNYAAHNCQTVGNDSLAIAYCLLSLKIKERLKDSAGLGVSLHTMAVSFFNRSNYSEALKNEAKAEQIFEHRKDTFRMAAAINGLGLDYKKLGHFPEALKDFQEAIYLWNKTGHLSSLANPLNNMGLIYSSLHNYALALSYYNKALALQQNIGDITGMVNDYENIASAYDDMHDTLHARIYYKKDLKLSQKSNYKFGMASAIANLGISYLSTNEIYKAIYYLQSALEKFIDLHDNANQAYVIDNLCNAYLHAPDAILKKYNVPIPKKWDYMLKLLEQSITLAKQTKSVEQLQNAYEILSEIYEAKKDYEQALTAHKQYVIYKDSLVNDDTKQQITRLEMQYQFSKTQDSIKVVTDKQQALAKAEIQKQHVVENAMIGGASFLILAGFCGFIFYKRNRDVTTQKNEAELQTQVTDTEMKALRAQMNPHFIFNSLNSIADYIDNNQTKLASDFTIKFAKLMRMVLENSEQKEIPLSDDLKTLELYMKLESYRLQGKFDYDIQVDDTIDKENTLVPPLILQPFVENSIWHGVAKKNGKGHITIHIQQENDMLKCVVEDDGDGMKESANAQEKKSVGMKITKARIDVINKLKNAGASMNVSNKRNGVRAEVRLPLELSF